MITGKEESYPQVGRAWLVDTPCISWKGRPYGVLAVERGKGRRGGYA